MQIEQQKIINYGYVWLGGVILSNAEVDGYNGYTQDLNRTDDIDTRNFLLDQRHKYLCLCLGVN